VGGRKLAENNYPQLPTTVWRGVREMLRKAPKRKLDEKILAVELNVQQTAAKAYQNQLVSLGLLNDDGTPTALADRWRQNDPADAIIEILKGSYPQELLDLAPIGDLQRPKIVSWFMSEGLGTGAAGNKAATYIMIAQSASGEEAPAKATGSSRSQPPAKAAERKRVDRRTSEPKAKVENGVLNRRDEGAARQAKPDLNINIQIHISADASSEQIESIFSSMKRYFDESD
jgi:hypothetical protein